MSHKCDNCNNCKLLQRKIDLYEKFIKDMKILESEGGGNTSGNKIDLEESIIIEKDIEGNRNMKVRSDLSESFLVVDKGKKLEELPRREHNAIVEQDNLHNYIVAKEYADNIKSKYAIVRYAFKIGKWFMLL